jgi:cytochrome c-type biogenesis protein CcmH/NrfG
LYVPAHVDTLSRAMATETRMRQSLDEFEVEFEREAALERQRRAALRRRAADRSRARRIQATERHGNVGFGALLVALTLTVIVVTVVMFETLAWLMA